MRDKYAVSSDPDFWPGTTVLRNLLDIRDQASLDEAEAAFAALAAQNITIIAPPFDAAYLKYLHRHLFADLYTWAGTFRRVDISKGNTRFCTASRIEPEAAHALRILDEADAAIDAHPDLLPGLPNAMAN